MPANRPTRAKVRKAYKSKSGYLGGAREMHPIVCAECGNEAMVPFRPRGDRPVYCIDCFNRMRGSVTLPEELSDRLDHLARLPQNWDSYGAVPISPNAITRARSTLREILSVSGNDIPLPFIAPSPDGGVELELTTASGRELMLDISPGEERVAFLLVEPTEPGDEKETEGTIGDLYTLKEVVRRLLLR